jgi:hypothetical protein
MTKLEELNTDLETHEASYAKLFDTAYAEKMRKFYNTDVAYLIPSYERIIASIKEEISMIESKKKAKAKAKKAVKPSVKTKKAVKTTTKKTPKNE